MRIRKLLVSAELIVSIVKDPNCEDGYTIKTAGFPVDGRIVGCEWCAMGGGIVALLVQSQSFDLLQEGAAPPVMTVSFCKERQAVVA
jgi:hypothetical protein